MGSWEIKNPAHLSASRVEKYLFNLNGTLLPAVLIHLAGEPGIARNARADDNVRDAQAHPILE
jgi:hypothetical protein